MRHLPAIAGLAVLLGISALIGLGSGSVPVGPLEVVGVGLKRLGVHAIAVDPGHALVLETLRAPRVALGACVGSCLAVSGALLQGLFRNPLADPTLIGVSTGASVGAAVSIVLFDAGGAAGALTLPTFAFVGAVGAVLAVLRIGTRDGRAEVATLLLAGIAVNAVCGATTGLLVTLSDEAQLRTLAFFQLGSLGSATWSMLAWAAPLTLLPVALCGRIATPLNALLLGEAEARHLGVDVESLKRWLVGLVCVGVGACVAASGVIGFVGLAVPHLARLGLGPDHRVLLPASALLGAALLVSADTASRTVVAPVELPVGILTTLLGGPFFLALIGRARRSGVAA